VAEQPQLPQAAEQAANAEAVTKGVLVEVKGKADLKPPPDATLLGAQ
jgi:hypothetical protein